MAARNDSLEVRALFDFLSDSFTRYIQTAGEEYNIEWPFYIMQSCLQEYFFNAPFDDLYQIVKKHAAHVPMFPCDKLVSLIVCRKKRMIKHTEPVKSEEFFQELLGEICEDIFAQYPTVAKDVAEYYYDEGEHTIESWNEALRKMGVFFREEDRSEYSVGDLVEIIGRASALTLAWEKFSITDFEKEHGL